MIDIQYGKNGNGGRRIAVDVEALGISENVCEMGWRNSGKKVDTKERSPAGMCLSPSPIHNIIGALDGKT